MEDCIGCGRRIWTPKNEHESGDWCTSGGDCEIRNIEGAERLRVVVLDMMRATCVHEVARTRDNLVGSCVKCHKIAYPS
jgi:hypothetical protein